MELNEKPENPVLGERVHNEVQVATELKPGYNQESVSQLKENKIWICATFLYHTGKLGFLKYFEHNRDALQNERDSGCLKSLNHQLVDCFITVVGSYS